MSYDILPADNTSRALHKISRRTAQQIVDTIKDLCARDINFIDEQGVIYASTDPARIGQFHEVGKQVILSGETIEVSDHHHFSGAKAGVNIPIIWHNRRVAAIGISGDADEVRQYAYLAQKISYLLLREMDLNDAAQIQRDRMHFILSSLIDPEHSTDPRITDCLSEFQLDPDSHCRILLIRPADSASIQNLAALEAAVFRAFSDLHSTLYTLAYPDEYLAVVGSRLPAGTEETLRALRMHFPKALHMTLGGVHLPNDLSQSYSEARSAEKNADDDRLIYFDRLGLELLCANTDPAAAERYQLQLLQSLSPDEKNLLRVYYQHDLSLAGTAEALFLHKNTIQYQLDRIHEKCGRHPRHFRDAAALYAALLLEEQR